MVPWLGIRIAGAATVGRRVSPHLTTSHVAGPTTAPQASQRQPFPLVKAF